jgi:hypothetical protein
LIAPLLRDLPLLGEPKNTRQARRAKSPAARRDIHLTVIGGQSTWTAPGGVRLGQALAQVEKLRPRDIGKCQLRDIISSSSSQAFYAHCPFIEVDDATGFASGPTLFILTTARLPAASTSAYAGR